MIIQQVPVQFQAYNLRLSQELYGPAWSRLDHSISTQLRSSYRRWFLSAPVLEGIEKYSTEPAAIDQAKIDLSF